MRAMLSGDASAEARRCQRDLDGLADESVHSRHPCAKSAPRRCRVADGFSTSPTSASLMKASRTGCRETPSCLATFRFRQEIARPQLQLDDRLLERLVDAIAHRRLAQGAGGGALFLVERIQLEGYVHVDIPDTTILVLIQSPGYCQPRYGRRTMKSMSLRALSLAATLSVAFCCPRRGRRLPAERQHRTRHDRSALQRSGSLFKANIAEASDGRLEINLYPNSQLGPDEDVLEQAARRRTRCRRRRRRVVSRSSRMSSAYSAAPLPLPPAIDGIRKVVTSDMFEEWVQKLREASGHQVLSFNWWQGERHLLTNKEINGPADLNGVRMRTPGAPVWMETISAMGATPTPMPWGEVYSAIQQNVDRRRRGTASRHSSAPISTRWSRTSPRPATST